MSEWFRYVNGNTLCEINEENGTLIMTSPEDEFDLDFPVNIDMNISNKCSIGCPFCYQSCTKEGKEADIKKFIKNKKSFLYSLEAGTELAINGNEPLHKDLIKLLKFCKKRNILANLTINEKTLFLHKDLIEKWMKKKLIHGLGISPFAYSETLFKFASEHKNVVVHTIVGVTYLKNYMDLITRGIKVLILGYKITGRGVDYKRNKVILKTNKEKLKELLKTLHQDWTSALISFDNLAITQLNPKELLNMSDEEYAKLYRGEDGQQTMFIDLVNETYAMNSIQPRSKHKPLTNDIKEMFKDIKTKK